jgi:DnaK suppressor protein|tara:strand:+ start:7921 stop:8280 length:360 start_codon:yes stop_codon:yes gene_type:complete
VRNLSHEQKTTLTNTLLLHQLELTEQLEISQQAAEIVTLDQTAVGRVSRIDALQQQSMAISTRGTAKLKLQKIAIALNAMSKDDYGYCRKCDEPIPFRRLEIQPEAAHCLSCQGKTDQR